MEETGILFHAAEELVTYLRAAPSEGSARGGCRLDFVRQEEGSLWILTGQCEAGDPPAELSPGKSVRFQRSQKDGVLLMDGETFPIQATRQAETLHGLLELVPAPLPENPAELIFAAPPGESALRRIATDSLELGNDRIQFAHFEGLALLRVQEPSFFLIQRCLEEGRVQVLVPTEVGGLYLPAGWDHPLACCWIESGSSDELVLFDAQGSWRVGDVPTWEDGYRLVDLDWSGSGEERLLARSDAPFRIALSVCLAPSTAETEPELWMMNSKEVNDLERLLLLLPEEEQRAFELAVVEGDKEDTAFVLRRSQTQRFKTSDTFSGRGFLPFQGLPNLLVPAGSTLLPSLRRDLYVSLFDLTADRLTLIEPVAEEGAFRLVRIPKRCFEPLSGYVDYLLEAASEQVAARIESTVFDLGPYLTAPARPDLFPEKSRSKKKPRSLPEGAESSETLGKGAGDEARSARWAMSPEASGSSEDGSAVEEGELRKAERKGEQAILAQGQSYHLWQQLAETKAQLGKDAEAFLCEIEARWLAGPAEREAGRERVMDAALRVLADGADSEPHKIAELFCLLDAGSSASSPEERDQWAADAAASIQEMDSRLRSKDRWLLWAQVLRVSGDLRTETRIRGDICDRIAERGLGLEEVPSFLRHRLFLDSRAGRAQESVPQGEDVLPALANLNLFRSALPRISSGRFRVTLTAALCGAYLRTGDEGQAADLLATGSRTGDACADAWAALLHADAFRETQPDRSEALAKTAQDLCQSLDHGSVAALTDMRQLLGRRADIEDLAGLLAEDNWERSYPRGGDHETGPLRILEQELEEARQGGNPRVIADILQRMMCLGGEELDDHVKLPQFVRTLAEGIEVYRWGDAGAGLVASFEAFCDRAPNSVTARSAFYEAVLHARLAHGLTSFDLLESATRHLTKALSHLEATATDGDFVDAAAPVFGVLEQLPVERRADGINKLLELILKRFGGGTNPFTNTAYLFSVHLAPLLRQGVEAAMGKDRLALLQFRKYRLQDEFLVLRRIQTESFAEPNA